MSLCEHICVEVSEGVLRLCARVPGCGIQLPSAWSELKICQCALYGH